jgi:putative addiction module killer protein
MLEIRQTDEFRTWVRHLSDGRAAKKIAQRIARVRSGLLGDAKYFSGIGELRINHGPGYRLYFVRRGNVIVVLLCGGDKSSQQRDIKLAIKLAQEV